MSSENPNKQRADDSAKQQHSVEPKKAMTYEELKAEIQTKVDERNFEEARKLSIKAKAMKAQAERAKPKPEGPYCTIGPKGGISVQGLQRWPVTLYANQWPRLLEFGPDILQYIEEHKDELSWPDDHSPDEGEVF